MGASCDPACSACGRACRNGGSGVLLVASTVRRRALRDGCHRKGDERAPLGTVEAEVDEFLVLYPDDPRAGEIERYKERIELDKLERKLRRESRAGGTADPSLLPAEQLYLQAMNSGDASPDKRWRCWSHLSIFMVQARMRRRPTTRVSAIVALAKRRLDDVCAATSTKIARASTGVASRTA